MSEESLSEFHSIESGLLLEEAQRRNTTGENDDQMKKLKQVTEFIDQSVEGVFAQRRKRYEFSEVNDDDEIRQDSFDGGDHEALRQFGQCQDDNNATSILLNNLQLLCPESKDYLLRWALRMHVEDEYMAAEIIVKQATIIHHILDSLEQFNDRKVAIEFFARKMRTEPSYSSKFEKQYRAYLSWIDRKAEYDAKLVVDSNEGMLPPGSSAETVNIPNDISEKASVPQSDSELIEPKETQCDLMQS